MPASFTQEVGVVKIGTRYSASELEVKATPFVKWAGGKGQLNVPFGRVSIKV